ncbi:MAG: hypothetical protein WBX50_04765, partial [Candidatus Deferrimicrobiaceae bacterium]
VHVWTLSIDDAPAIIEKEEDVVAEYPGRDSTDEHCRAANRNKANREDIPTPEKPAGSVRAGIRSAMEQWNRHTLRR